jgi:hypothetical protein
MARILFEHVLRGTIAFDEVPVVGDAEAGTVRYREAAVLADVLEQVALARIVRV